MTRTPSHWPETLRAEVPPMLRLAAPVVVAELAWVSMGLVDTLMTGRYSSVTMGAVGLGHAVFFAVVVVGMGLLLSLDYFVARAHGAGQPGAGVRHLIQGLWLCALISPLLMGALAFAPSFLVWFGVQPEVVVETASYLVGVTWSLPLVLVYTAARRYLQAIEIAKPVMIIIILANLVNLVADWALIFGHLGAPAMGASGAGWATLFGRLFMAAGLLLVVARHQARLGRLPPGWWRPDLEEISELARLGLPASAQLLLEVGMFTAATLLAGLMDPLSLAAHQIALQMASFTFMMPMGISSAGAVRVGNGLGRGDIRGATAAGWVAMGLGLGCMSLAAGVFIVARVPLVQAFSNDPEVLPIAAGLLLVAAVFQIFDAAQVIGTGILRGLGDTRSPMIANLIGHWLLGLPAGATLAFRGGMGVKGLWVGLAIGLGFVGVTLIGVWTHRTRALALDPQAGAGEP